MQQIGRGAIRIGRWTAVAAFVVVMILFGRTTGAAAAGLAFDAELSLTGGCTTEALDTVPDPGCPYSPPPAGPSASFSKPRAVVTDTYGNIYVASFGSVTDGRIDIFDPDGNFISELAVEGPATMAVDSTGELYVTTSGTGKKIVRFTPAAPYDPEEGEITYETAPTVVLASSLSPTVAISVDRDDDHLYAHLGTQVHEWGSAAEGNPDLGEVVSGLLNPTGTGLAVDSEGGRIYVSNQKTIRAYELDPPHALVATNDGSTTPGGEFANSFLSAAVDEGAGIVFVYDIEASKVHEFTTAGTYLGTIERGFQKTSDPQIGVDNGAQSPNGKLNPLGRSYLFVPSHPTGVGHSFAFEPPQEAAPVIEEVSFDNVTTEEAELRAAINPEGVATTYAFEYISQQAYEENGNQFTGAAVAGEGQIPAGKQPVTVSAGATGLQPGTAYLFRVRAENSIGPAEPDGEGSFTTYPLDPIGLCPNDALRTGFSALLPDCRAYELVTPPDTNSRAPLGLGSVSELGTFFASRLASPAGDKFTFHIEGGAIPGSGATGSFAGDPYLATRTGSGWSTAYTGPSALEAPKIVTGSTSPDQGYSFWSNAGGFGSTAIGGLKTSYVRYPDGHSALVGRGSLGTDPRAFGRLISPDGGHILFATGADIGAAIKLEPNAPPNGIRAIYDRTADETTHVVSLLPGDVTPTEGAIYIGASSDGEGVAFRIDTTLYLRHDNEETYEIGDGVTFAGVAEGGERLFYLQGGDLLRFDAADESVTPFTTSGDVTPVNVSADGSAAYFVSPSVLTGSEANPSGDQAVAGEENLYLSREGQITFVGTLTERDVEGKGGGSELTTDGLGLWTKGVGLVDAPDGRLAIDPSRTTPNGEVLLFSSRAELTGYETEDHPQIYRYDFAGDELDCLSCNPTGAPASGDATLQEVQHGVGGFQPLNAWDVVRNLRSDGRRAFFQSTEALVAGDNDGLQDVYQWEDQGIGTCTRPGGCVQLISSGHSHRADYLYAVSDSGNDVFFLSSDLLLRRDSDATPSVYDARVGGGFAEPEATPCEGEGCRPTLPPPPFLPSPGIVPSPESGNWEPRRCPKGKHKVKRQGKVRCVKNKKKKHQAKKKAGTKKKGARR